MEKEALIEPGTWTALVNGVYTNEKPEVLPAESTNDSIDDVVEYEESKPNLLKVAAKGTLRLVNKTCWYYPFIGALPGKYQE